MFELVRCSRPWICFGLFFLLLFSAESWSQGLGKNHKTPLAAADLQAIEAVVKQYFDSFPKKDATALDAYWSSKSPQYAPRKAELLKIFSENENIVVKGVTLRHAEMVGAVANVRAFVDISMTTTKTGMPSTDIGPNRFLELVKNGGIWKIEREISVGKEIAARMVKTKSNEERDRILKEEHEWIDIYLARGLTGEGNRLYGSVPFSEILDIYRLGLKIAQQIGDKKEIAGAYNSIGNALKDAGNSAEALEAYQTAARLSEEGGFKDMAARVLGNIGIVYNRRGEFEKALEFFQKSLSLAEELGNAEVRARALGNIGTVYAAQGDYARSLDHHLRALKLKEQLGDTDGISGSLSNIGNVYSFSGYHAKALEYYERSVKISETSGNKQGMAIDLYNAGNSYKIMGDHSRAMAAYEKSLNLSEAIGSNQGIAGVSINIGGLYSKQGNYAQALTFLNKAFPFFEREGNKYGMMNVFIEIANVYWGQEDYARSIEFRKKAIKLSEETGNNPSTIGSLSAIGGAYLELLDFPRASEYIESAIRLSRTGSNPYESYYLMHAVAELELKKGEFAKALETAKKAETLSLKSSGIADRWSLYVTFARALRGLNRLSESREYLDKSIDLVEDLRTRLAGGEGEQQRFFESRTEPYQLMIRLLIEQKSAGEALSYAERAKSRALLDLLNNGRVDFSKSLSSAEREEGQRLKYVMISLNAQISAQEDEVETPRVKALRVQLNAAQLQYDNYQTQLYTSHPELSVQRGEMNPINLAETGVLLSDAESALLEFSVADDKSFLFVITKATAGEPLVNVYPINVKRKDLAAKVESYRAKIANGDLDFHKGARELYDLLIKPAQEQLGGKTNLIIVPDGPLWDLPFQALRNNGGQYLVEQAAVSYAPSLTALREMSKKTKARKPDSGMDLLAFGNPIVGKATAERVRRVFMSEKLEPLPEAERLVNELGRMYGPKRSKVFTGAEARETIAKTEAGKYRVVQFATHGILNNLSPMYSHLVFAQNENNPNEDGLLEAWELKDLDLNADLVILSACDTARGRISNGEGVIGMTWASFIAGAPSTVASQWKVESSSTTELMLEFHRRLLSKKQISKSEALRQASLKVMRMPKYKHPSYWAGFVLVGDGS